MHGSRCILTAGLAAAALAAARPAAAHVKWFTGVEQAPLAPPDQVLTWPLLAAFGLSLAALVLLTRLNRPLQQLPWVQRIHAGLERLRPWSLWLIRLGLGLSLLAAGASGFLFHFELLPDPATLAWAGPVQIALGVLCLWPWVSRAAAAGVIALYLYAIWQFGLHHMLDYLSIPGAAAYLLLAGQGGAIPVLYITTGISLAWLAVEKWLLPAMALDIVAHHQLFTFGMPAPVFIMLAGWVELAVGYLLITGVLNRFLSLVLTGLFVLTSTLFGLSEVLGHWLLHTILLVFLIEGTGPYVTPVDWHRGTRLQLAFVGITLIPFVAGLMALYYWLRPL